MSSEPVSAASEKSEDTTQVETDEKSAMPPPAVPEKSATDIEKEEEVKLRSKYPGVRGPGSSTFLQQRLSRGQRYFDSGDYNMAKAKSTKPVPSTTMGKPIFPGASGDTIPPAEVIAHRKPSLVQSRLADHLQHTSWITLPLTRNAGSRELVSLILSWNIYAVVGDAMFCSLLVDGFY